MSLEITAVPITPEMSAGYCVVLNRGGDASVSGNRRPQAQLSVEIIDAPVAEAVVDVPELERHPASAQAFFPMNGLSYLIVVCRSSGDGKPDLADLKAFVVPGDTAVQYQAGVWHAPIRTISRPGRLGMVVHKAGTAADCELAAVRPFRVGLPVSQASPSTMP